MSLTDVSRRPKSIRVAVCIAALATTLPQLRAADAPATGGEAVVMPNARQFDFTSKVNGLGYRVFVYRPLKADPATPLPVVYLCDGNWYFGAACDAMRTNHLDGLVVAVGYPTDDPDEIGRRRSFDLSLPNKADDAKHGGGDAFLRVVDEEVKPLVAAHYAVDPARQALFGHSLGGLMVLRQLFRRPAAYSTYLATSPSIWWAGRAVLADEAAFTAAVRSGDGHIQLLLTSAGDEEYHGDDAAKLANAKANGMVSNATNLATRLATIDPKKLAVTRVVIDDETHPSGAIASLVRALMFALPAVK